jgi:hypothetical protein
LWLELSSRENGSNLHHRDVVGVALSRLEKQLHSGQAGDVFADIDAEINQHPDDSQMLSSFE